MATNQGAGGTRWAQTMSNSFADFLTRLHNRDDAAAQELFGRLARQLVTLSLRYLHAGFRHKVDPEDVVQSAYKSFFFRYGAKNLDVVNWNSLWGLLARNHRAEMRRTGCVSSCRLPRRRAGSALAAGR